MSVLSPPAGPPTKLGVYRQLSTTAGVHVSPIQLGAMNIGVSSWKEVFGDMSEEAGYKLLDAYYDAGGNFIDTANSYHDGESEATIGKWAEKRGIRDELFIATKYTGHWKRGHDVQQPFFVGNSNKSLHLSVEASLKKLRTTYIDLLYVHWWDFATSIEEVMRSLHTLILARKVLYLGVSDTPAWVVSKANQFARDHGLTPFCIYQGKWNVLDRDFEREIIPMARSEGMALAPWAAAGAGRFMTDEEEARREASGEQGRKWFGQDWKRNEDERKISAALNKVAKEVGTEHITAVAIAYLLQKAPYVFPIVGGRKVEHLQANIKALDITLSKEQISYLESVVNFNPGFPAWLIGTGEDYGMMMKMAVNVEKPLALQPHGLGN